MLEEGEVEEEREDDVREGVGEELEKGKPPDVRTNEGGATGVGFL